MSAFAKEFPGLQYQPTEIEEAALRSIAVYTREHSPPPPSAIRGHTQGHYDAPPFPWRASREFPFRLVRFSFPASGEGGLPGRPPTPQISNPQITRSQTLGHRVLRYHFPAPKTSAPNPKPKPSGEGGFENILPPVHFNCIEPNYAPLGSDYAVMYAINLTHISPWEATLGFLK